MAVLAFARAPTTGGNQDDAHQSSTTTAGTPRWETYQPGQPPGRSRLGVAALVVGVVVLLLAFLPALGTLLALGGVALGVVAMVTARRAQTPTGLPVIGTILSGVAVLVSLAPLLVTIPFIGSLLPDDARTTASSTPGPSAPSARPSPSTPAPPRRAPPPPRLPRPPGRAARPWARSPCWATTR